MIKYVRFPFMYDAANMRDEVTAAAKTWIQHFNTADYEGSWSGISLRSPGGATNSIFADAAMNKQSFADTPLMAQCPYIKQALDTLACDKLSVRLLKLDSGAIIKEHRDAGLNFESGEARLHIPVITHPLVEFYLDGDRLEMNEGSCWYVNANLPHRAANNSPADRIHLVIDCVVNDWLTAQFNREDLPVKSVKDIAAQQRELNKKTIAELRRSGNPINIQLAEQMEQLL